MSPQLTDRQREAALRIARGDSYATVSKDMRLAKRTIVRWAKLPEFTVELEAQAASIRETVKAEGIVNRQNRLDAYNDRWRKMQSVIDGRAADKTFARAPGYTSGLLVHQYRTVGRGEDAQVMDEFAVDTGLLKEMRELEKQAAQDAGDWTEKREVTGKDGEPIAIREVVVRMPADDGEAEDETDLLDD